MTNVDTNKPAPRQHAPKAGTAMPPYAGMPLETLPDPPAPSRNVPQVEAPPVPILQWSSGHEKGRPLGQGRFAPFVGFHVERGKDPAFDALCAGAGVAQMEIRHQRDGGIVVAHWSFGESLRLYPVTSGPPVTTIGGCLHRSAATAAAGLGLSWPQGERSRLAVRGLLLVGDAPALVQLSVRSTMTGHLLAALLDHVRVCTIADDMIDRAKHPEVVTLHELALPLVAGTEITAGRGESAQITPFVSDHPADVQRGYVTSCWRRNAVHQAALAAWGEIVVWAAGYRSGETNGDSQAE